MTVLTLPMLQKSETEQELDYESNLPEPSKKRSVFFIVLLCIIFFFSGCLITRAIFRGSLPDDPKAYDPITLEPRQPQGFFSRIKNLVSPPKQVLAGQKDERINILLLGQGGPGHDGPYLTDTILLTSLDTKNKKVAFTSIPRDLFVNIPDLGYRKINSANSIGETKQAGLGPAYATNVVQKTFDIEIPYYILVDFKAFEEIIDVVGGVDIQVDKSFTDAEYPIPGKEDALPVSARYKILNFTAGPKHMDGQTALEFIRSRHGNNGEGSDFARSKRQQKVILALKQKVLSAGTLLNPIKINEILNSLESHITTNLQFADIIAFLKLSREFDTQNIISLTLDNSPTGFLKDGYSSDGAYILQPKTGNFNDISLAIKNIFTAPPPTSLSESLPVASGGTPTSPTPAIDHVAVKTNPTAQPMKVEIKNGTWTEGLASRVKNHLEEKNILISTVGNTTQRPKAKSGLYILTKTPLNDTVELLKSELHIPVVTAPSGETPASNTDILVVLGEDYKE